jgi:glycosyltransferase involved in cell wall biosynthesis
MGRALRSNLNQFDVVHLHSVFLWPTATAARLARQHGIPYVVAPRGMLVRDLICRKSSLAKRAWITLFERKNIEQAAAVHVTSELESKELKELGLRPRRIALVPNGVDLPPNDMASLPAASTSVSSQTRPVVLFLGRVNWKKGLDRLIPAIADVPEVVLVVAGNDEDNYRPTLVALAERLGVAGRVRFLGPVNGAQKWDLLRTAQMLVLPSYSENFGNVILESMGASCPVVVTREVGLAPAVRKANAGLVVDGDPKQLAAAINELLRDRDKRRRMGEAGRRLAIEQFSWDAIAGQMVQVYADCARERANDAGPDHAGAPHL